MCLQKRWEAELSLNLIKCVFTVMSGIFLGHIISKEGIAMVLDKVKVVLNSATPKNIIALSQFLG